MRDDAALERRREALQLAAELQRRNLGLRWQMLGARRSVHWLEAAFGAVTGRRGASGVAVNLPWSALARAGVGVWSGRRASGRLAATLALLRRPSWWSAGMLAAQWWWRRRQQRLAGIPRPIGARRARLPARH